MIQDSANNVELSGQTSPCSATENDLTCHKLPITTRVSGSSTRNQGPILNWREAREAGSPLMIISESQLTCAHTRFLPLRHSQAHSWGGRILLLAKSGENTLLNV